MSDELSKSAKRRAAKKARDEAFAEEQAAPAPMPEPKAKAKAKAEAKAAPAPAAEQPKANAKGKAKAAPAPAPEPEPKAKAAAKGKAKAAPAAEPAKEAPKAKAKAKAAAAAAAAAEPKEAPKAEPKSQPKAQPKQKAAAKAKAAAQKEEEEVVKREELIQPFTIDDGSGGWEVNTGLSKKAEKKKEKQAQAEAAAKANAGGKAIPGLAATNSIPGMAPAVQRTSQAEINAFLKKAEAAGAAAGAAARAEVEAQAAATSGLSSASVKVPEARIGVVIGPKGKNIQLIQEKTGVNRIDTSGEVFTITGNADAVAHAERAIKELIEKGYWSGSFENFKEEFVNVHPSCFPDLIGKGGVTIKAMKTEFGVEVTIPEVPKNAPAGKKYKVTLAGKNENVEACKQAINNIAMYGYDEITHPGFSHEELDVPDWAYRFLIGKAGSELRHIQNNYKVKVNIPREHSMCQSVVCVGEKLNVERAKAYIDKLLWNAENQSKGREKAEGALDTWGQEEEEEDWMKAYMYKRA
eukprot:TRINITY_DN374_c0_g1_i3.p1 TRINITY_DN374_c0_g1~~TRINITY_DN374_c0_g1_i3.p1  ORF type:complete len:550 (-),score=189.74 TRINITY_DN374_c0_g1_i3:77-1642(-)